MTPRHRVWVAMANLFLESNVPLWYPLVAREFAESPFSMTELETKLKEEVAPAYQHTIGERASRNEIELAWAQCRAI